jgi:hypothetical protein
MLFEECHPECFMGGVIQRLYGCMGGVIQRLYGCMGFILLSMREKVFERGESIMFEVLNP